MSRPAPKRLTPADRERIVQLYAQRQPTKAIAEATGYGVSTITLVLREARAEGDMRAAVDPDDRAQALEDRALCGAARSDGGPALLPAEPAVASNLVLSLMARGLSREKAVEQATLYRARKEQAAATARPVDRVSSSEFRQSLHVAIMEQPTCKRLAGITATFDQIPTKSCGETR